MDSLKPHETRSLRCQPIALIFAMLLCTAFCADAMAKPVPKYLAAVKQEIARLGYRMTCLETEGLCTISPGEISDNTAAPNLPAPIEVIVDDESATVRFILENLLPATDLSLETAKKLLLLNNELMVAKISVDEKTDAVVLSAVVNTDSNFDRKTFRSVLKGFMKVASELTARFGTGEDQN